MCISKNFAMRLGYWHIRQQICIQDKAGEMNYNFYNRRKISIKDVKTEIFTRHILFCNSFLVIYDHVDCCSFRWQCSGPPKGAGLEVEKLLLYLSLLFLGMKVQHETVVHSHIANTIKFRKTGNLFQTKNKDKFSTGNVTNKMHYHWWAPKSCFSRHHG